MVDKLTNPNITSSIQGIIIPSNSPTHILEVGNPSQP